MFDKILSKKWRNSIYKEENKKKSKFVLHLLQNGSFDSLYSLFLFWDALKKIYSKPPLNLPHAQNQIILPS